MSQAMPSPDLMVGMRECTGDRTEDLAEAECCGVWWSSDRYNAVWRARVRNW